MFRTRHQPQRSPRAFRWTSASGVEELGLLPDGAESLAYAISSNGAAVAGYGDTAHGAFHAFLWTSADGMQDPEGYHFIGGAPVLLVAEGVDPASPVSAPKLG